MKQEILHLLKVVIIGICCKEIKGHRDHKTFMSFPPLPYFHHNNEFFSPDFLPFKNGPPLPPPQPPHFSLAQPPHLPYKSPTFPPLIHDNLLPPPPFLPNIDLNFPFQHLPLQQNFPLDLNQNYLNNYYYFPYDTNIDTRDELGGVKAPIQIIPSRFPPRIEALIERIQNYFSTYNPIEDQRPDYDPNLKPPLVLSPPMEVTSVDTVGNKIGNMTDTAETNETTTEFVTTESPVPSSTTIRSISTTTATEAAAGTTTTTTTTERAEETTPESEEADEGPDTIGPIEVFLNKKDSEDDNKTEENHENEEPGEDESGETFTEETEETTTERRNEETTENDVEVEVITLERKKPDDDKR